MFSMPIEGNSNSNELEFEFPQLPEFSLKELLMLEKESSGMYFSGHPIESYKNHADYLGLSNLSILHNEDSISDKAPIKISAMVTSVTVKTTKRNEKMAFVNVEDRFGEIECILFADKYIKFMHQLRIDSPLMIEGNISIRDDEAPRIIVSNIDELIENSRFIAPAEKAVNKPEVKEKAEPVSHSIPSNPQKIYLKVPDMKCKEYLKVQNLVDIFGGTTQVIFYNSATKKYISYSNGIGVTNFVINELCAILGKENVVLK